MQYWYGEACHQKNKLDKLFKVQKECMRPILNVGKTAHTDPVFKRLKILKVTQMIDLELYKLGFKIYKNNYLHLYYHFSIQQAHVSLEKRHKYNTHQKKLPNILPHTSLVFNNSFMCKTISKFMSLSNKVKKSTSLSNFTTKTKSMLIR